MGKTGEENFVSCVSEELQYTNFFLLFYRRWMGFSVSVRCWWERVGKFIVSLLLLLLLLCMSCDDFWQPAEAKEKKSNKKLFLHSNENCNRFVCFTQHFSESSRCFQLVFFQLFFCLPRPHLKLNFWSIKLKTQRPEHTQKESSFFCSSICHLKNSIELSQWIMESHFQPPKTSITVSRTLF